ncbi:RDD family protein [Thermodesulfitimonas autotrophica]|uniref:RDD family protein n=1 Tax=Thermodesulfitimonas autotrophica TaxID=1894989 RepID=UPI002FDF9ABD
MYCSKCGFQNPDDAKFCAGCGSQLGSETVRVSKEATDPYAGFWKRFVAACIDDLILVLGGATIGGIFGALIGGVLGGIGTDISTIRAIAGAFGYVLSIALNWLYFTLFESSSKQATPGKMVMGIVVTDLSGNRISFGRANARYWSKILSAIILFIGFIMAGFTRKKQALHDIIAGTLVVRKGIGFHMEEREKGRE